MAQFLPHQPRNTHLDTFALAVYGAPWRGKAGKTDRDVLLALVGRARRYGTTSRLGVAVVISHRDVAQDAGVSRRTLTTSIHARLKPSGWFLTPNANRKRKEAGTFILLPQRPNLHHLTPVGEHLKGISGEDSGVLRFRHGGLGKKSGQLLDALRMLGGSATVKDVATAMHEPRPDRLRQDYVLPLAAGGIVDFDAPTDTVRLSDGWQQNLEIERGLKGEIKREERQRHAAERYWFHLSRIESERADG